MIDSRPSAADQAAVIEPILAFRGITKRYGRQPILQDLDLEVRSGSFTVIYGPPSAGKTVLARILMGLEDPDAGQMWLRGEDVTPISAADRNIGYVPQSFALFPHLSVRDNIAYPLKLAGIDRRESNSIVAHAAEMLHIADLLTKRPDQLSGGQKQRVAIARGIAKRTDVFLLDDPLAGLDFKLRERLVDDLRTLQEQTRVTLLYTTSDPLETLILADDVAVLDGGSIVESGNPETLYSDPRHARTMTLLGFPRANLLAGDLVQTPTGPICRTALFTISVQPSTREPLPIGPVSVAIRPESFSFDPIGAIHLATTILLREDLGGESIVYLDCSGVPLTTIAGYAAASLPDIDQPVIITLNPSDVLVFSPAGSQIARGLSTSPPQKTES